MKRTHCLKAAAALTSALAVAACGGGDGASAQDAGTPATVAKSCEVASFANLTLADANDTSPTTVAADSFKQPGASNPIANLPSFCQVKGQARPTSDSLVNFELWVPTEGWNGKLVVTGNGGYSPNLSYSDMAYAMRQGYAVMGGDTGHQTDGNDMFWGVGHPEKIKDWGTRSINAITVPGKSVLQHLQGRAAARAYYYGCSTGGHQGLAEVQQYPGDFDGVIAGAPGNNRVALNAEFLWRYLSNRLPNTNTLILTPAKAALITNRAVAACDALDGVTDGIINDPSACTTDKFNVASLQCTGADAADCLTSAQVAVAQKIYAGPKNPRTGQQIYPGMLVGSESGWSSFWGGSTPSRSDFWALWAFENPRWDWWTFDFDRDFAFAQAKLGPLVDQNNADISAFKARGGKLIAYHGLTDAAGAATETIGYYQRVRTAQGSQQAVDSFFRLFLAPGMAHCSGGAGPNVFGNSGNAAPNATAANDLLKALDRWVEQGTAPDSIVAARITGGAVSMTRPLCPYPKKAVYKGSGDTNDVANFSCQ